MNTGFMSTNVGCDIGEDPFEVPLRPAQPTLDAAVRLRPPLLWLRRQKRPPLDVKRAGQHRMEAIRRCELIPMDRDLYRADRLFEQAETKPAPEWWMHTVLGVWLDSRPAAANIREAFRCGIVDSMYRDPEVWGEDYLPGFSAPVIAHAIREDRRQDTGAPPSAGGFLALCAKHREQFRRWRADINDLLGIRQNAEDILIALGDARLADLGCEDELESKDLNMERPLLEAPPTLAPEKLPKPLASDDDEMDIRF
jgi:hypothetical protein